MKMFLDNRKVEACLFTVNSGLNYGRFSGDEQHVFDYTMELRCEEFITAIEAKYCEIRDEIKEDDRKQNETSEFSDTGYCALPALMQHAEGLSAIFLTYLDRPLFEKLLKNVRSASYIINSSDAIEITEDTIKVSGKAFKKFV